MNGAPLRVVFLGTPQFAVPTLQRIVASRHSVVAVVTQPDRPRGRGQQVTDSAVKAAATVAGIPVLQPSTLKDPAVLDQLRALHADIGVVAAYGKILSETVLAIPRLGMINVHASLLPRYRGAAPIHRAVIAGETVTGVTIMRVVKALDAGAMIEKVSRHISEDETSEDVERDLAELGAAALVDTLDRMALGRVTETPQDDSLSTYAHRLTKDDGIVQWDQPARAIHNQIRGLYPWPHAFSHVQGRRIIFWRSQVLASGSADAGFRGRSQGDAASADAARGGRTPGTIVAATAAGIDIATGDGVLRLTELQAEGKKVLKARDYLAGHRLVAGDRFSAAP